MERAIERFYQQSKATVNLFALAHIMVMALIILEQYLP
jgi:hypothetical protein